MGSTRARVKKRLVELQTAWSIAGITLIVAIVAEAVLQAAFYLKDRWTNQPRPDRRVLAEGYGGEEWPVRHYRELEELRDRWEPYVYFRQQPFVGTTISIGAAGLRRTWQPPSPAQADLAVRKRSRILMLGGSSLWGFGARDDQTIPSLLARELFERKRDVELRNLSEIGYVSTQELVALLRELLSGYRPDVVIFYDGVNDTTSALLEREAGVTTNERNRRAEFNLTRSNARLAGTLVASAVTSSAMYRLASAIRRRLDHGRSSFQAPDAAALTSLAADVIHRYAANIDIVERLGHELGFRPLFYWQPQIITKRDKRPFEREEAERFAWTEPLFAHVAQGIRTSRALVSDPAFHDLSALFADARDLVFIDYCHTTERANARVAAVMADDVVAALEHTPLRQ
jgi:hypothetical protein